MSPVLIDKVTGRASWLRWLGYSSLRRMWLFHRQDSGEGGNAMSDDVLKQYEIVKLPEVLMQRTEQGELKKLDKKVGDYLILTDESAVWLASEGIIKVDQHGQPVASVLQDRRSKKNRGKE